MDITTFNTITARHLNNPMVFVGDNSQIFSETTQQSTLLVDKAASIVHIISPNSTTTRGDHKVILKSFALDQLQYISSVLTTAELKTVLAGLKTANVIDGPKEIAINALFANE